MRPSTAFRAAVLLLGAIASASAAAHGVRFGFHFGFPVVAPFWLYPAPVYHYPPVVTVPAPVYIEQRPTPAPEAFWYFCADTQTYYPYVRECASPWQRVPIHPPR